MYIVNHFYEAETYKELIEILADKEVIVETFEVYEKEQPQNVINSLQFTVDNKIEQNKKDYEDWLGVIESANEAYSKKYLL